MKLKSVFIIALLSALMLSSCQTKEERVISKMNNLAERIEKNAETYDTEDWEAVLKEYQQLQKEAANCKFSSEQLHELGRVEGKLTATMTRESAKSLGRNVGDILQNGSKVLHGVFDGINESLQDNE